MYNNRRCKLWMYIVQKNSLSLEHGKVIFHKMKVIYDKKVCQGIKKDMNRTKLYSFNMKEYKLNNIKRNNLSAIKSKHYDLKLKVDLIIKESNFSDDSLEMNRQRSFSYSYKNIRNTKLCFINTNFVKKDVITDEMRIKLENILTAYAIYDFQVGYAQGMNYITAMLLSFIDDEAECFWFLVQLMQVYNLRGFFLNNTPRLKQVLREFKSAFKQQIPDLYIYYKKIGFYKYITGIISHFFITLFTYNVYVEFGKIIIDYFLILQEDVLIDTLIHLFMLKKNELIELSFDESAVKIKSSFVNDCIEEFGVEGCIPYDYLNKMKF